MNPADAMNAALDRASLTRESITERARAEAEALDALVAWRRADRIDETSAAYWDALGRLITAADRLIDDDDIRAVVKAAQAIVRGELPCGHRDEDRCDACTPDGVL